MKHLLSFLKSIFYKPIINEYKLIPTVNYFTSEKVNLEKPIRVSNEPRHIFTIIIATIFVLLVVIFTDNYRAGIISMLFWIFSIIIALIDKDQLMLNRFGIKMKGRKLIRWEDIEATYIEDLSNNEDDIYNLIVIVKGKIYKADISSALKDYKEIANLIEHFKVKHGKKSIVYSLRKEE